MTAREFAKENGIEIVGKLTKKVAVTEEFDWGRCEMVEKREVYWIDEAGNEFMGGRSGWCCITADGGVI